MKTSPINWLEWWLLACLQIYCFFSFMLHVFSVMFACVFLTSSSSSTSTSRIPESCSDVRLSLCPPASILDAVDIPVSFLPRRPIRGLGCEETDMSRERCICAWRRELKHTGNNDKISMKVCVTVCESTQGQWFVEIQDWTKNHRTRYRQRHPNLT